MRGSEAVTPELVPANAVNDTTGSRHHALNALVEKHPRWGFWMCFYRLRLMGHTWNHKRVYRVYTATKLNLTRR